MKILVAYISKYRHSGDLADAFSDERAPARYSRLEQNRSLGRGNRGEDIVNPQPRSEQPHDSPMMSWLRIYASRDGIFSLDSMMSAYSNKATAKSPVNVARK